jgi:hypothetical protein
MTNSITGAATQTVAGGHNEDVTSSTPDISRIGATTFAP